MSEGNTQTIETKLRQAWHQERRFYSLRGISRFLIWLVAMLILDFLIDWGIFFRARMSTQVGYLLLAINAAVLGWVLWHEWLRHLKPFDPVVVALEVETRHPELSSLLVSYTQLKGPMDNQPNISRALLEAMREQAIIRTRPLDFREVVDFGQLKKLIITAGCVLLVFGAIGFNWQEHLQSLLMRLIGMKGQYPSRTQILDISSDEIVRSGDPATITASIGGVVPEYGRIYFRPADSEMPWQAARMEQVGSQPVFRRELPEVHQDLLFYIRIGDDQSEEYRLSVVPAPKITSVDITLKYPKYLNTPSGNSKDLNFTVPEDTEIQWNITSDLAVKSMKVTIDENDSIDARVDNTGRKLSFSTKADKPFKYSFHWVERDQGFKYDDVQHSVRVAPDAKPDVELLLPTSNGLATTAKRLQVRAQATDDHGLKEAHLVYSIGEKKEKRLPIFDCKGLTASDVKYEWSLKKTIPNLEPGERIMFAVEVTDLYPGKKKHVRRSATRELTIVTKEQYMQWFMEELAAQRDKIKRAKESEEKSSTEVKQIKNEEAKTP